MKDEWYEILCIVTMRKINLSYKELLSYGFNVGDIKSILNRFCFLVPDGWISLPLSK